MLHNLELIGIPFDWEVGDAVYSHYDRIYGQVPVTPFAAALLATQEIRRLHHISHLGLLSGMVKFNTCASKYEHSLGVYHLVIIVLSQMPALRPYRDLLIAAALGHDARSPFWTHTSEAAQFMVTGVNHESALGTPVFARSEFAKVVRQHRIDWDELVALMQGKHRLAMLNGLIHGILDLDTLDGTCRYALMWHQVERGLPYSPRHIAYYYTLINGEVGIQDAEDEVLIPEVELSKFQHCRRNVFLRIHGREIQSPQSMLERALYLAATKGEMRPAEFWMTDEQAADKLTSRSRVNKATRELIQAARLQEVYALVYEGHIWKPNEAMRTILATPSGNQHVADGLAKSLALPREHVCVMLGKHKGVKSLEGLPCLRDNGLPMNLIAATPYWYLNIYVHPDHCQDEEQLERRIENYLSSLL